ncbi:hypothetical protein, partial [Thiolapillus sp.]
PKHDIKRLLLTRIELATESPEEASFIQDEIDLLERDMLRIHCHLGKEIKRVFGLVIDFGTSQSPKSTRPLTTYLCPSRPGHPALRNNFASSLLLRTWLPMTGRRVRRPTLFSLWRKARRENSAASRLLGSTSLRFALHGWQRQPRLDIAVSA